MLKISNRKAYFEYTILEEYCAGIVLTGTEVKSIRNGDANISNDSFVYIKDGELWIKNLKVSKYKQSHTIEEFDENRDKKLLLTKKEISKIQKLLQDKGTTMIPLEIFGKKNLIKIKVGVAKGKKNWDKKESIKKREIERELRRGEY